MPGRPTAWWPTSWGWSISCLAGSATRQRRHVKAGDLTLEVAAPTAFSPGMPWTWRSARRISAAAPPERRAPHTITDHIFLGNISEYYASLHPARRCGYRPIRARFSRSAKRWRSGSKRPNAAYFAVPRLNPLGHEKKQPRDDQAEHIHIRARALDHEGAVRLFLWEKRRAERPTRDDPVRARVLDGFPADVRSPGAGRPDRRRWTTSRLGYDTWCVDMEGYGRSDKHRDINSDIRPAPTTWAATDYIAPARAA